METVAEILLLTVLPVAVRLLLLQIADLLIRRAQAVVGHLPILPVQAAGLLTLPAAVHPVLREVRIAEEALPEAVVVGDKSIAHTVL